MRTFLNEMLQNTSSAATSLTIQLFHFNYAFKYWSRYNKTKVNVHCSTSHDMSLNVSTYTYANAMQFNQWPIYDFLF